jgi:hypothetical protein
MSDGVPSLPLGRGSFPSRRWLYNDAMPSEPYRQSLVTDRSASEALARQALARDLMHDELLAWAGRPKQGIYLSPSDALRIPFSVLFCGFVFVWEFQVISTGAPFFMGLFGIPFVLMGLYQLVGRFFVDARKRAMTFYGITNRRVLIVSQGFTRNITGVDLANSREISLEERSDGTGTIFLGKRGPQGFEAFGWQAPQTANTPTLQRVPDAREVFNMIRHAQEALRAKDAGGETQLSR